MRKVDEEPEGSGNEHQTQNTPKKKKNNNKFEPESEGKLHPNEEMWDAEVFHDSLQRHPSSDDSNSGNEKYFEPEYNFPRYGMD